MADYLSVAVQAARQAGQLQLEGMRKPVTVREATRHDIKLQTDVDCEDLIRAIILEAFPNHAILGEEGGGTIDDATPTWIVDPLDGTVNYARRIPHFCSSIALQIAGETVVGVIYDPVTDELYTTESGSGAYLNGERISVSNVTTVERAAVAMGFAKSMETISSMMQEMHNLVHIVQKMRIFGAAAPRFILRCGRTLGWVHRVRPAQLGHRRRGTPRAGSRRTCQIVARRTICLGCARGQRSSLVRWTAPGTSPALSVIAAAPATTHPNAWIAPAPGVDTVRRLEYMRSGLGYRY